MLVALFVSSTTLSVRGTIPAPENFSQSPLVRRIDASLVQPVKAGEISLAGGKQDSGCAKDGERLSVPPGATCYFTIHLSKPAQWQFNRTKRLKLRLTGAGRQVDVRLARQGNIEPQEERLQNPAGGSLAALPSPAPGTQTPAPPTPTPQPTPTPVQLTVYDPENQGQDWLLTLKGCALDGEGNCQVELVP